MEVNVEFIGKSCHYNVTKYTSADGKLNGKIYNMYGNLIFIFSWNKKYKFPILIDTNGRHIFMSKEVDHMDSLRIHLARKLILACKDYTDCGPIPKQATPIFLKPNFKEQESSKSYEKTELKTPAWFMIYYKKWTLTKAGYWRRTIIDPAKASVAIPIMNNVVRSYCNRCSFTGDDCDLPCAKTTCLVGKLPKPDAIHT
jgi:hypothetical protein